MVNKRIRFIPTNSRRNMTENRQQYLERNIEVLEEVITRYELFPERSIDPVTQVDRLKVAKLKQADYLEELQEIKQGKKHPDGEVTITDTSTGQMFKY